MEKGQPDSAIRAMSTPDGLMICPYCVKPIHMGNEIMFNGIFQCKRCFRRQVFHIGRKDICAYFGPDDKFKKNGEDDDALIQL